MLCSVQKISDSRDRMVDIVIFCPSFFHWDQDAHPISGIRICAFFLVRSCDGHSFAKPLVQMDMTLAKSMIGLLFFCNGEHRAECLKFLFCLRLNKEMIFFPVHISVFTSMLFHPALGGPLPYPFLRAGADKKDTSSSL